MKKFTKIMLSVAAVTAVSSAMAASAMAMTAEYKAAGTDGYEVGTVVLNGVDGTGTSQTLLVLNAVDLAEVKEENIKQIDQKDDSTVFASVPVGDLDDGTYEVRIGGTDAGELQITTFTVGGSGGDQPGGGDEPGGNTHEVLIGDVDQSGRVTSGDAGLLLTLLAGRNTDSLTGDALIAAQKCNGLEDNKITAKDAGEVLTYNANKKHDYVNTKIEVAD